MKVHPFVTVLFMLIAIKMISKAESTRKTVILNEIQVAPSDKFIEIRSEESSVSLDGYSLVVMDISKERECGSDPRVKVRGVLRLQGKRTVDHYAFVGKFMDLFLIMYLITMHHLSLKKHNGELHLI